MQALSVYTISTHTIYILTNSIINDTLNWYGYIAGTNVHLYILYIINIVGSFIIV